MEHREKILKTLQEGGVLEGKVWKQERPEWCTHKDCIFKRRGMNLLCGGELPEPQSHGKIEGINTHRFCIRAPRQDNIEQYDLTDLQLNADDLDWFRWIFDALDGKMPSWLSKKSQE